MLSFPASQPDRRFWRRRAMLSFCPLRALFAIALALAAASAHAQIQPGAGFGSPAAGVAFGQGARFGQQPALALVPGPALAAPPAPVAVAPTEVYHDGDAMQAKLADAAAWIAPQAQAFEGMQVRVLPMDHAAFLRFVRSRASEGDDHTPVGHWALEALLLADGEANGDKRPLCFLLYNPRQAAILESAFFEPARRQGQESTAIAFVVAHETGHCVDFLLGTSKAPPGLSEEARNRWLEYGADLFAGLSVLEAGAPVSAVQRIAQLRGAGETDDHSTGPGLDLLIERWQAGRLLARATPQQRWQEALELRRASFR
jgi:hypothetical protein